MVFIVDRMILFAQCPCVLRTLIHLSLCFVHIVDIVDDVSVGDN